MNNDNMFSINHNSSGLLSFIKGLDIQYIINNIIMISNIYNLSPPF